MNHRKHRMTSLRIAIETPDQPEVLELLAQSDAYADSLYPPEGNFGSPLEDLMRADVDFIVVRKADGEAIGCGAVKWFDEGSGELKRIFVDPAARGMGAGRALMEKLEELAHQRGVRQLYLETGELNVEAVRMYKAFGYAPCGPFGPYEDNPYSLFMSRSLGAN